MEEAIETCVKLLFDQSLTQSQKELYKLTIEQAYINLEDLVHFLSADDGQLDLLTNSQLVKKSFMLISEPNYQNVLASVKIMTRISYFLKELSEDNKSITNLLTPEMRKYVL